LPSHLFSLVLVSRLISARTARHCRDPEGIARLQGADQVDSEWKYVPVRRLYLYVEHSIDRGTQWAVSEPNDESTWARLREQISVFLTGRFHMGAFAGRTPDESYFVRSGNDTMTEDDIDNGRLNMVIGIALLDSCLALLVP
jgi:phage tail sheath protein FI